MTNPQISDISSSSMLVEVNISTWTGRKTDRVVSSELTASSNAEAGTARVTKDILGNCAELKAINKHVGDTRNNLHYHLTMPWSDSGLRLLTTPQYFTYHEAITGAKDKFFELVDKFLDVYDDKVDQAANRMGSLFNAEDYMTKEEVSARFSFRIHYLPLPSSGDFRVDVGNEALSEMKEHYEEYFTEQLNVAMSALWQRIYENVSTLARQLDYNEAGKPNRLYESVFERVQELTDMLGTCNVTGDPKMTAMKNQLEDSLFGLTVETLKEDTELRQQKKREMNEVLRSLPSLEI